VPVRAGGGGRGGGVSGFLDVRPVARRGGIGITWGGLLHASPLSLYGHYVPTPTSYTFPTSLLVYTLIQSID